jgi:serine/threonine protein kinase/Flp pilus assembly protein TadD
VRRCAPYNSELMSLPTGTRIGPYEISGLLGAGGMGEVYRARDTKLDRDVALKVLSESYSSAIGVERFEREISVTAKFSHPGIVSLFDSGSANGRLYYVMPLVPGENLRARLARDRRLTQEDAAALVADVADALAVAHRAGVVHRDVKPENIFVVSGRALLADFGIAYIAGTSRSSQEETIATPPSLTLEGTILGTLAYLSPEQASSRSAIDGRSDLYSLGCVLYELLAGAPPFVGTPVEVIGQHLSSKPVPLADRGVGASASMNALIDRLLAKDPAARPGDAAEVAAALRNGSGDRHLTPWPMESTEADRLLQEGIKLFQLGTVGSPSSRSLMDQAGVYFRRALAASPRHARAIVMFGNWHFVMARLGFMAAEEAHRTGRGLLLEALDVNDQISEVHASMAKNALYYDDDLHAAERHAQRSIELAPHDPEALRTLSIIHKLLGRRDEAILVAQQAVDVAPTMMNALGALAEALRSAGRYEEEVQVLRRAIKIVPSHTPTIERLEWAFAEMGDLEASIHYRALRLRQSGQSTRADHLQRDADTAGAAEARRKDLLVEIDRLLARSAEQNPFDDTPTNNSVGDRLALTYSQLGDWPNALAWIERAYADRPGRLRRLLMELPFDRRGLATERRFVRLLQLAGLEELLLS